MTTEQLTVGSEVVDAQHLSRGIGKVALKDTGTVSILFDIAIVVYPTDSLGGLFVVPSSFTQPMGDSHG